MFHDDFVRKIAPLLQPWPMPRSIVILDNAKIHMYAELEQVIHNCCSRITCFPPYSPQLNPMKKHQLVETMAVEGSKFSILKVHRTGLECGDACMF